MKHLVASTLLITAFMTFAVREGNSQNMCIIVNAENPVSTLTASQVKLTYLRKINKRWKELNKNIVPVDAKTNGEGRKKFLTEVLDMTQDELTRYFTEREYQNAEAPPMKLTTDEEILAFVSNNIGAIAFVPKSLVKPESKVKIVLSF